MGTCRLLTRAGVLVPRSEPDEPRHPRVETIDFHPNGQVARMKLAPGTLVATPIGRFPAELITFHPNGAVRRVFPVAGRLAPDWTEDQERELVPVLRLETPAGVLEAKCISIHWFSNGGLRSVTLWPSEKVMMRTPVGEVLIRQGISFGEDGSVSTVEPAEPIPIMTPIGQMLAWDPDPIGLHADANSLEFDPSGRVVSLVTAATTVQVRRPDGSVERIGAGEDPTAGGDACCGPNGLRVGFLGDGVRLRVGRNELVAPLACVSAETRADNRKHLRCLG